MVFKIFVLLLACVTLSLANPPFIPRPPPFSGGSMSSSHGANLNQGSNFAQGANAANFNEDDSVKSSQASSHSSKKVKVAANNDNYLAANTAFGDNQFNTQNTGYVNPFGPHGVGTGYYQGAQGSNQQGLSNLAQGGHSSFVSEAEENADSQSSNFEAQHHRGGSQVGEFSQGAENLNQAAFDNQQSQFYQ